MMEFAVAELTISQIEEAFRDGSGRGLAQPDRVSVYFTDIAQLAYTSALIVSPLDHAFLWAPDSVYQFSLPVARPSARRARWTLAISESKASKKKFLQALAQSGSAMERLPYGSVAYLGDDMGLDELWSRPLWPGWHRAYAFPASAQSRQTFMDSLRKWFEGAGKFGVRRVAESEVTRQLGGETTTELVRDRDLFEREPESDHARTYREECQQILATLKREIEKVEGGQGLTIESLSAAFQAEDCCLRLIDYGVKDERRRLSEAVGKYRAHLLRVLRWPIFVEIASAEIVAQERVGLVLPAYGSEPTPYDGWQELKAYLQDMRSNYPAFFEDPLEALYP